MYLMKLCTRIRHYFPMPRLCGGDSGSFVWVIWGWDWRYNPMAIRNSVFGAVQEHLLQGEGFRIPSIKIAMTELFFPLVYINSHEGKKLKMHATIPAKTNTGFCCHSYGDLYRRGFYILYVFDEFHILSVYLQANKRARRDYRTTQSTHRS